MRTWNLTKAPITPTYKNPKSIRKLVFQDRLNTKYVAIDDPIDNYDLGEHPTYKDYIRNALDPNIDTNQNVYGIAKTLKPLTTCINDMKSSIDGANSALFDLRQRVAEHEAQQQEQEQTPVEAPQAPVENGGNNV